MFLRRLLFRPSLRLGFQLRVLVARPPRLQARRKTSLVETEFETENLFIGGRGGRLLPRLLLIGPVSEPSSRSARRWRGKR